MEITLDDVLMLEPRLTRGREREPAVGGTWPADHIDISWAVSARTTAPHLPLLRGRELLLVSRRVTAVLGSALPALTHEAAARGVSAFVFDSADAKVSLAARSLEAVPVLYWDEDLSAESETAINRLLTENRGNLYRIGSELERGLSEVGAGGGSADLVSRVYAVSALPIVIFDARGGRLAAAPDDNSLDTVRKNPTDSAVICRELGTGAVLVLGPLTPSQRIVARFLVERIASAANSAVHREVAGRPRGSRRTRAIEALLAPGSQSPSERGAAAVALGLDPDGLFMVAVSRGRAEPDSIRALTALGTVHAAGKSEERQSMLIAVNERTDGVPLRQRTQELKWRWMANGPDTGVTLALSAPARGVSSLPRAASEARFVAALQTRERLSRRAASFDAIDDVGATGLLYQVRDSADLRQFVADVLGALERGDRRGVLRATLRAFLESGGSHVATSTRLAIHRNTLAYRIRRIGALVGRDITDPGTWLELHLAVRASDVLECIADDWQPSTPS